MKNYSRLLKTSFAVVVVLLTTACEKNFLDVNNNPNRISVSKIENVLPSCIGYTAYTLGNHFFIIGGLWGQYVTQGPGSNQYNDYDSWSFKSTDMERVWRDLYAGTLKDLQYIEQEATKTNNMNYVAIAKIWQAYVYQILTDAYGDIPFSEALKSEDGMYFPKYDNQEAIYDGLIRLIDAGLAVINTNPEVAHPTNDDIIYGGNMSKWIRFANTLKLKIYMRQSLIRPAVAQTGIQKMVANGAQFIGEGEDAEMKFFDDQFNRNPMYALVNGLNVENLIASATILDNMLPLDTRIDIFFKTASTGPAKGQHNGLPQGRAKAVPAIAGANSDYSRPGNAVTGATAPVIFMAASESYFLQAEAVTRGWMPGNPKDLYERGIKQSFTRWGKGADAAPYIAQPEVDFPVAGTVNDKVKSIITEKWLSMCCNQNFESWTEWRRTGYPDFFEASASNKTGDVFPVRLVYPSNDILNNPNTVVKPITERVWWDIN